MVESDFNLLIVDDQHGVRRLLYEAFNDEGYKVKLAAGGLEAIKMIFQEMPDMVLLDFKMPGMSGLETLAELKKVSPDLPVLLMTAYGDLDVIEQAKKLGIKHHITKPFDINEVRLIVKGLLLETGHRKSKLMEIG
jgi:two-component system response regulator (stage 0 sporulation protein F)